MQRTATVTDLDGNTVKEGRLNAASEELAFYEEHAWCLNVFPTVVEAIDLLRREITGLPLVPRDWRRDESVRNVFLLACAVSDAADDYLLGPRLGFSRAVDNFGPARLIAGPMESILKFGARVRESFATGVSEWRDSWEAALVAFTKCLAGAEEQSCDGDQCSAPLLEMLSRKLPANLLAERIGIPAAFRSQDLTHFDAFHLGRKVVEAFPDRTRPVLVIGLRTAGSYFAPLLRGYLESRGYECVVSSTLRPKRGLGFRERAIVERAAQRGALATIIDEPVGSASTVAQGLNCLREAGFKGDTVVLFPVHHNGRNWKSGTGSLALSTTRVLTLEPEEWHKQTLLEPNAVCERLQDYFGEDVRATVEAKRGGLADQLTAALVDSAEPGFHCRLKRVYEVKLEHSDGSIESRLILAKSVGWGWLGYHAFLAGNRLASFVPPVLGLRDGILYMEWCPAGNAEGCNGVSRERLVERTASYVAARVRRLALDADPTSDLIRAGKHRGSEELASVLSGAYGSKVAAVLKRPRIQHELLELTCDFPTLIDGKMRPLEWVDAAGLLLKTDFEHHGMGKHQLNLTDPAYDLAEAILHWKLDAHEERELIREYGEVAADYDVGSRLFLYKLLAGTWAMARAADNLKNPEMLGRHQEFNQRYLAAWEFLVTHTTRFCAGFCARPERLRWSCPLVVLDVDGVLDKQIFGFPSTTAAGIQAVSLLARHGMAVALNTARSVAELKEYCRAYGFVGGVAEYGSFAWDAVTGREAVLVSAESRSQMDELKKKLRDIPGVFLNDACQFSVRAYAYARGTTVPVPEMLVRSLMASLKLDRLRLHQTFTDSTVTASEVDKGTGLLSLQSLAGQPGLQTIAVGDSEADLPMFRVATRSFAPRQIFCSQAARLLGCRIASRPYQLGLVEIVRSITHPDGRRCDQCALPDQVRSGGDQIFLRHLCKADQDAAKLLVRALFDPKAIRVFLQ